MAVVAVAVVMVAVVVVAVMVGGGSDDSVGDRVHGDGTR